MTAMLNPLWLNTFVAAAAAPSFSEAARRLGLAQPTVSEHIRQLELALKRRLFLRDTHSLALTSDGRSLLVHAEIILDAHERAERLFDAPRLRAQLEQRQIRFVPEQSPYCWAYQLIARGSRLIQNLDAYGVALLPEFRERPLPELRDAIDREFFLLSEAHYDRYIAPRFLREGMDLRV